MDAPFPLEDPNDFRIKYIYLKEDGNISSVVVGTVPHEIGILCKAVSPRFNEDFKKWNFDSGSWEDIPRPPAEEYTPKQIAQAIKDNDRETLDNFLAFHDLDK